jgi:SAM-dependent methyltransferase
VQELIAPAVVADAPHLAERFARREPFRHVVIDGFLAAGFVQRLLEQFPPFDVKRALNEAGEVGGKAVNEQIRALGGAYAELDDLVQSREFLALVSRITGVPDLLYDPHYFGGGTHENRQGQDLDPHVDFNRHPIERWHRRLNLIVYLNPEWDDAWGGSLELHSDPRREDDRVTLVTPAFNRCVIFETTEWSWHGFSRIDLPEDKRELSRRSIALYFYTRERPAEELADTHSTIYVDRPLPERFAPGHVLSADDVQELKVLLTRRDQHNQRLYRDVTQLQKQLDQALAALLAGRLGRLRWFAGRVVGRLRRWLKPEAASTPAPIAAAPVPPLVAAPAPVSARAPAPEPAVDAAYAARIEQERAIFAGQADVHELPPIYHYWSNAYPRRIFEQFGFSNPDQFFVEHLVQALARTRTRPARFLSIGAGNCDTEVRVAAELVRRGHAEFTLECVDINPVMLERGRALAAEQGVHAQIVPVLGDFNTWTAQGRYDAVIANQSLHHVVELEHLFDAIHAALTDEGLFVVSDVIGRNGHRLWPEARAIVQEFWQELPAERRFNLQLRRHEEEYLDWDCSNEGFEGIRAQDILPLLIERFGFELFIGFANVISPFIDRAFGPHFDPASPADRAFIDRIHARDEAEMLSGRIKPTHMLAAMRRQRDGVVTRCDRNLTPRFCVRPPLGESSAAVAGAAA